LSDHGSGDIFSFFRWGSPLQSRKRRLADWD
jgi:hypothetical protein